jgi:hypothetical protein
MPITPFLRNQAFDADLIETMSAAFVQACATLGLSRRTDPSTGVVARQIIEGAQRGLRTMTALYLGTIQEFKPPPH